MYLLLLNNKHSKRRVELGKQAVIIDESMMKRTGMEDSKTIELEQNEHAQRSVEDDNGLNDLPDLQNEDFIYVY